MFFIFGVGDGSKRLDFYQNIVCPVCGRFGSIEVCMLFTCLSLFFIPVFRWNRRYIAKMSCCGASCELDRETGSQISRGALSQLDTGKLRFSGNGGGASHKRCASCGYMADGDFDYCPKCGRPL